MPNLQMGTTRYLLNRETIKAKVSKKIGNYALGIMLKKVSTDPKTGKKRTSNKFVPKYVGRSDTDLQKEIIQQGISLKKDEKGNQLYTHFAFTHKRILDKTSYIMERKNYHDFGDGGELDNKRHPKRPSRFDKTILPCAKPTCNH
ncbi:MAG: hypothetical protein ACPGVB_14145 [Chitinophagales bacterium]